LFRYNLKNLGLQLELKSSEDSEELEKIENNMLENDF